MKILLSSVFGPYGVDDAYGRKENVMELFHNQVTREQGIFSLRFNHPSFGLHFIADNITPPTVILDFPSEARFVREIKRGYDYIGIGFIVPNFIKAQRMARLVRQYAPNSKIVLGGHGTMIPGVEELIPHDFICRGEGVAFFRALLGEDVTAPLRHPAVVSGFNKRIIGASLPTNSAVLVPGVGCPNACRFCATSHFFEKRYTSFFDTGQELFDVCVALEKKLGVQEFFIMDENFLKRPERARELLRLMEQHHKYFRFGIFSSAETINDVGVELLARLGLHFLWLGVESKREVYEKNRGVDLAALVKSLRDHGISVLASGILFLEHHDQESIWEDIRYVVSLQSDFVQFMGLGPLPGTALYKDYDAKGLLRKDLPYEEWHGQHQIWFRHPYFTGEESAEMLRTAFRYDFDTQGSSLLRICDTLLRGYHTLATYNDPHLEVRRQQLGHWAEEYRPGLGVLKKYAQNEHILHETLRIERELEAAFGPMSTMQVVRAKAVMHLARREAWRVATGRHRYQPKTILTSYRVSWGERAKARLGGWFDALTLPAAAPQSP
jgi:radical SAM superfamily enzyme YgiQ (UPF0313 family)